MSEYIILQNIPGQATALFLDVTDGTADAINPDDTVIIFAVENGTVVRQPWDGAIAPTPNQVFSATGTRLLGIMTEEFHDCSVYKVNRQPDGSISFGDRVIDPSSI